MIRKLLATLVLLMPTLSYAKIVTKTIDYKDGDVTLKGYLAYDDAVKERRPGVLVCPEWWGLNDYAKQRAEQIAALGYVAFAIDYYGDGKVAQTREEAQQWSSAFYAADEKTGRREKMRRRAMAGLSTLKSFEQVEPSRLAAIGYCMGGTVSLELARAAAQGDHLKAVVSFHGGLSTPCTEDAKQIKASILVCHGALDGFVPDTEVAAFKKEMDDAKIDYQFVSYAGAVHSFTNPAADSRGIEGVKYNKKADERSWSLMGLFLAERLSAVQAK